MFDADLLPPFIPHPDLVAVQRPRPADIARTAGLLGWLAEEGDRFRAAVPADGGRVD